jgi:hypothetical protein
MAVASKYYYTFRSSDGKTVKVLRGDGAPKATDGFGGWEVVNRPRRIGLTQWNGRSPYGMDVPILFDDIDGCETEISKLFQMAVGYDYLPPPTVQIDGAVPIKGAKWVINGIDWGDDVHWNQTGNQKPFRTRQDATVHLLEYKPEVRSGRASRPLTRRSATRITSRSEPR